MILVLLGPPGAGKGTQAVRISEVFGLVHLSSGDILRAERKAQTDLGRRAQDYMDRGLLVPDDLILSMMMDHIRRPPAAENGSLLDGFPRTLAQAEGLDSRLAELGRKIDAVISIEVSDEVAAQRLAGRSTCSSCGRIYHDSFSPPAMAGVCDDCGAGLARRRDDAVEVVHQRLKTYHEETKPLVEHYRKGGVLKAVSGVGGTDEVTGAIKESCRGL